MSPTPFILVFCKRHRYCFIYSRGNEQAAISTMIEYAMDDRYNFGWSELRSITAHLQEAGAISDE